MAILKNKETHYHCTRILLLNAHNIHVKLSALLTELT